MIYIKTKRNKLKDLKSNSLYEKRRIEENSLNDSQFTITNDLNQNFFKKINELEEKNQNYKKEKKFFELKYKEVMEENLQMKKVLEKQNKIINNNLKKKKFNNPKNIKNLIVQNKFSLKLENLQKNIKNVNIITKRKKLIKYNYEDIFIKYLEEKNEKEILFFLNKNSNFLLNQNLTKNLFTAILKFVKADFFEKLIINKFLQIKKINFKIFSLTKTYKKYEIMKIIINEKLKSPQTKTIGKIFLLKIIKKNYLECFNYLIKKNFNFKNYWKNLEKLLSKFPKNDYYLSLIVNQYKDEINNNFPKTSISEKSLKSFKNYPIYITIKKGYLLTLRKLIKLNINIYQENFYNKNFNCFNTPILYTIEKNNFGAFKILIETDKNLLLKKNKNGENLLHFSAFFGRKIFIDFLVNLKIDKLGVDSKNKADQTCLFYAIWQNKVLTVKFIVEELNADLGVVSKSGFNAIHYCCYYNRADILKVLLKNISGSKISEIFGKKICENENRVSGNYFDENLVDKMNYILEKNINFDFNKSISFKKKNNISKNTSVGEKKVQDVKKIFKKFLEIEKLSDCKNDNKTNFQIINSKNSKGQSPLIICAEKNYLNCMKILLDFKCDINVVDSLNKSAAVYFSEVNNFTGLNLLHKFQKFK